MQTIFIENLKLNAIIGTLPHERIYPQELRFDLTIFCDADQASFSDDLHDAVDYSAVETAVAECVEKSSFQLLEALCRKVGMTILSFDGIESCRVKISKPGASQLGALISYQADFSREKES